VKKARRRSERIKGINKRYGGPISYDEVKRKKPNGSSKDVELCLVNRIDEVSSPEIIEKDNKAPSETCNKEGPEEEKDMSETSSSLRSEKQEPDNSKEEEEEVQSQIIMAEGQASSSSSATKDEPEVSLVNPLNELLINFLLKLKESNPGVEGLLDESSKTSNTN